MTTRDLTPRPETGAALRRTSPFHLLQREIDRVFDDFSGWRTNKDLAFFTPSMEVSETDKAIEVTTELPGLDEKDVDISISGDVLSIRGEKKAEREEKEKNYRVVERSYGSFQRSLALPPGVDAGAVTASMTKGVLKITLPKPASTKPQKIQISQE